MIQSNESIASSYKYWPQGKGVFVRALGSEAHGTSSSEQLMREAMILGLSWVMLPGILQYSTGTLDFTKKIKDFAHGLRSIGVEPLIWGWVIPSNWKQWLSAMDKTAFEANIEFVVVNAEKPWLSKTNEALEFTRKITDTGVSWALSSYGAPYYFNNFPWKEFLDQGPVCGMPQIYDMQNNQPFDYPTRSHNSWVNLGYYPILPTLDGSNAHSSSQMSGIFDRVIDQINPNGISWWSLDHIKRSSSRSNFIKNIYM